MRLYEKSNIAEVLKQLRVKKKLSQEALADKIGCSRVSITMIETGNHKPNYELLCRWTRACGQQLILRSIKNTEIDIFNNDDVE